MNSTGKELGRIDSVEIRFETFFIIHFCPPIRLPWFIAVHRWVQIRFDWFRITLEDYLGSFFNHSTFKFCLKISTSKSRALFENRVHSRVSAQVRNNYVQRGLWCNVDLYRTERWIVINERQDPEDDLSE